MQFSPLSLHAVKDLFSPLPPCPHQETASSGHSRYISYQSAPQKRYIHIYRHTYIGLAKAFFPVFSIRWCRKTQTNFGQPKTCTYIEAERQTERQRQTERNRKTDGQTNRKTDRQVYI